EMPEAVPVEHLAVSVREDQRGPVRLVRELADVSFDSLGDGRGQVDGSGLAGLSRRAVDGAVDAQRAALRVELAYGARVRLAGPEPHARHHLHEGLIALGHAIDERSNLSVRQISLVVVGGPCL